MLPISDAFGVIDFFVEGFNRRFSQKRLAIRRSALRRPVRN
jgi:hypothetical protein